VDNNNVISQNPPQVVSPPIPITEQKPEETNDIVEIKFAKKKHSWISYVFIVLSIVQVISEVVSAFSGHFNWLPLLGAVYYSITAFALFKKPVIGYIMFGASVLLFFLVYILYRYTSTY